MDPQEKRPLFMYSYDPPSPDIFEEDNIPNPFALGMARRETESEYLIYSQLDSLSDVPEVFRNCENLNGISKYENAIIADKAIDIHVSESSSVKHSETKSNTEEKDEVANADIDLDIKTKTFDSDFPVDQLENRNSSETIKFKRDELPSGNSRNESMDISSHGYSMKENANNNNNYSCELNKTEIGNTSPLGSINNDVKYNETQFNGKEHNTLTFRSELSDTLPPMHCSNAENEYSEKSDTSTVTDDSYKTLRTESKNKENCDGSKGNKLNISSKSLDISPCISFTSKNENSPSSLATCEASDTFYPSDLTEEARCLSPESTSQSLSSLPSDTITMNVPFDSSSTNTDTGFLDFDVDTPLNSTSIIGLGSSLQNNSKAGAMQSSSTLSEPECDSALQTPSPVPSPPLTESCTITPFPTDFPTPYSTNPTSSPLPSPVSFDALSAQHSESSPSTPSTVTSSTMFCVSRKLENLTNASVSNCASNKKYVAAQNNETTNASLNNKAINVSHVTKSSVSDSSSKCFHRIVNSRKSPENQITQVETSQLNTDIPENSQDCEIIQVETSQSNADIPENSQDCEMIYRYSPAMENSSVNELKKKFAEKPSVKCHQRQLQAPKLNQISENLSYKETNLETSTYSLLSKTHGNNEGCDIIDHSTNCTSTHLPPPPPPRKDSSLKVLPPPLPPPPCEEETEDEESAPPVPLLPGNFIENYSSSAPPLPPVRQYLLIPLIPGRATPIILTPPTTPHLFPCQNSATSPPPPPPPPPRQINQLADTEHCHKDKPESINSFNENPVPLHNSRFMSLARELTPVPEEATLQDHSPSPTVQLTYSDEYSLVQNRENGECNSDHKLFGKENASAVQRITKSVTDHSTTPSVPPPLPPKPSGLKLSPYLKSPPPPPPCRSDSLPGTPNSGTRLSPCRLKDRSPPNDRKFTISSTDNEAKEKNSADSEQTSHPPPNIESKVTSNVPDNGPPSVPDPPPPIIKSSCMSISPYGRLVINRSDIPLPSPEEEIRKVFVNVKNWGWIEDNLDTLAIYTQFRPIIQQGPQCGLIALSMASQTCPTSVSIEALLQNVKAKGISRHGEMFSAEAMCELANERLKGVTAFVRRDVLTSSVSVIRALVEGDLILFPYDSEPNHFPGQSGGRKAHWGLLCGCLVQFNENIKPEFTSFKPDSKLDNLWHYRPVALPTSTERASSAPPQQINAASEERSSPSISRRHSHTCESEGKSSKTEKIMNEIVPALKQDESHIILLYRQGKSRNLIYATLEDIRRSNAQLFEYPETEDYVIGSVEQGLCKQVVVLRKNQPGLSDLLGTLQEEEK